MGGGWPPWAPLVYASDPTHTLPDHWTSLINFLHLLWSIASSVFSLHAWQSFLTTSLQVLFGLPLCLRPCTSYTIHFFTQASSSFRSTCPYHRRMTQKIQSLTTGMRNISQGSVATRVRCFEIVIDDYHATLCERCAVDMALCLSVCLSICLSVAGRSSIETAE